MLDTWRIEIRDKIRSLRRQSRRIIYIDETVFTWKSIKLTEYSPLHHNHRVPQSKVIQPVFSLILAISEENGLEHFQIFKKYVNRQKFMEYLDGLYVENKHEKITLFADNLQVHRSP